MRFSSHIQHKEENTKEVLTWQTETDTPSCMDCGMLMVRNGSCYKCINCGTTSGCS